MRIVCQKCSAAYAIDDKLVTPKGIRAQCPRCRHLQLVKQGDAAPAVTEPQVPAAFSIPAPPPAPPPLPPQAAPEPAGDSDLFFDFSAPPTQAAKAMPPLPPPPPPPAVSLSLDSQSGSGGSGDMLDFSDLGDPPPEPATSPRGLAPLPSALKKSQPPPSAPKPAQMAAPTALAPQSSAPFDFSGDFSFDAPAPSGPPPPAPAPSKPAPGPGALAAPQVKCKQCGKVLTDPFDQALGICDDCRNSQSQPLSAADSTGRPTSSAISSPPPPASPRAAPSTSSDAFGSADEAALPEVEKKAPKAKPRRSVVSAYREGEEPEGGSGKVVAMAAVLVLLFGAGGTYLFIKKPWVKRPPPLAQKLPISSARPIDAMVERWKAQFPTLTGSAAEHLAAGEEKLALDNSSSYAEAEAEFQKALVLDKSNDRAIAGWALALAFGKGDKVDADTQKMAEQMLLAAEQRGGDARVYVAHAHLLLVRAANLNDIQVLAERGTSSPSDKDKALAYLALGQAYLTKNPKTAEDNFALAVKADPKLKRAYLYQVRFMVSQGDYRTAVLTLEKRLEGDPDQLEAADLLARLYLDVGEVALAKKTYQKVAQASPGAVRPKLLLAVFAYQHDADFGAAAAGLDAVIAQRDGLEKSALAEALGHRAAVARLQGDLQGAVSNADAALQLNANEMNARVQKALASVAANAPAEARAQVSLVKVGDPAFEAMLDGRVMLAEGKHAEAFERLKKSF
ncbi:MAG: zinc-ribbon domain-containing protein, partial [Myxococcaceae bacterium]|nr:zinc-ribbon domain-containing protein [Myxococcaceae bacterium]